MSRKQPSFHGFPKEQRAFSPGKRTTRAARQYRPRATKEAMHLVLRSDRAKGTKSLLKYNHFVRAVIAKLALRHGVRVYRIVNAGNHLHITLRLSKQFLWHGFISGITGGIARAIQRKRDSTKQGFWNSRPFTRLISWGRDYNVVKDYHMLNQLEAEGAVPPRSQMLKPERWRHVVQAFSKGTRYTLGASRRALTAKPPTTPQQRRPVGRLNLARPTGLLEVTADNALK